MKNTIGFEIMIFVLAVNFFLKPILKNEGCILILWSKAIRHEQVFYKLHAGRQEIDLVFNKYASFDTLISTTICNLIYYIEHALYCLEILVQNHRIEGRCLF